MINQSFLFVRSLIFFLGQAFCAFLFGGIGVLLFAFFPYRWRYQLFICFSRFSIWWAKVICGIRYEVTGLENLPKQNAIVIANHQSAWETLFFQVLLPPQTWILKKSLLYIPFFGWGLALLEPIAINRKQSRSIKTLLTLGKKRLAQGRWIIIFPEGTRVAVGETHRYSRSGAMLSKESGYPVVPITHNAGVFWPKNSFIKKPGIIQVYIGPSIEAKDRSVDEIQHEAQQWITETLKTLPQQP